MPYKPERLSQISEQALDSRPPLLDARYLLFADPEKERK